MNNSKRSRLSDKDEGPCKIRKATNLSDKKAIVDLFSSFVNTHHFRPNPDGQRIDKIIVIKVSAIDLKEFGVN